MGKLLDILRRPGGFSLIELVVVIAVVGVCAGVGVIGGAQALRSREARAAAQSWQAAAAWAQTGLLWHGGRTELECDGHELAVRHDSGLCGGVLNAAIPGVPLSGNVARWRAVSGWIVKFGGVLASPDSGGSLFFGEGDAAYRVVVRPESGLTARSLGAILP